MFTPVIVTVAASAENVSVSIFQGRQGVEEAVHDPLAVGTAVHRQGFGQVPGDAAVVHY